MKTVASILTLSVVSILPAAIAAEAAKPAAGAAATALSPADGLWKEIESMLQGPKERPKTQAEFKDVLKKYFADFDAKAAEFRKTFPSDPRRWKITLQELRSNSARQMVGAATKSEAEIAKIIAEISEAKDAAGEVKEYASFAQIQAVKDDDAKFAALVEAHKKQFPNSGLSRQLDSQMKTKEMEKEVKSKPLEIKFTALDGKEFDLAALKGKVVLVDFWATWCGPCIAELPNVISTYKKLHDKGFEIVGISFDQDKAKLESMIKDKEMPWPQYFDGQGWKNKFGQQFGINSIPRMWLVDKKGMVVDTNGRENLAAKVEKLLAE